MTEQPIRILGIDLGKKRVGLAIGNNLLCVASAFKTIEYGSKKRFIKSLRSIVMEEEIELIVIGLPKNMDSTEGESANFSRRMAELVKEELKIEVELVDERLSTVEAIRQLHQVGEKIGKSKEKIDMLSAAVILQSYLDNRKRLLEND